MTLKKYHLLSVLNDFTDKTEKHDLLDLPEHVMHRKMRKKSTLMSQWDKTYFMEKKYGKIW